MERSEEIFLLGGRRRKKEMTDAQEDRHEHIVRPVSSRASRTAAS
jgi:hypothetical protein